MQISSTIEYGLICYWQHYCLDNLETYQIPLAEQQLNRKMAVLCLFFEYFLKELIVLGLQRADSKYKSFLRQKIKQKEIQQKLKELEEQNLKLENEEEQNFKIEEEQQNDASQIDRSNIEKSQLQINQQVEIKPEQEIKQVFPDNPFIPSFLLQFQIFEDPLQIIKDYQPMFQRFVNYQILSLGLTFIYNAGLFMLIIIWLQFVFLLVSIFFILKKKENILSIIGCLVDFGNIMQIILGISGIINRY